MAAAIRIRVSIVFCFRKTAGVQSATVNFMTQKMIVEFAEGQEPKAVMEPFGRRRIVKKGDCTLNTMKLPHQHGEGEDNALLQDSNSCSIVSASHLRAGDLHDPLDHLVQQAALLRVRRAVVDLAL